MARDRAVLTPIPPHSAAERALNWLANRLPGRSGQELMGGFGLVRGLLDRDLRRRAFRWAARHRRGPAQRLGLAATLLANDGRFQAFNALVGFRGPAALRSRVRLEGQEFLDHAGATGTLLLGFHVGPLRSWLALQVLGYRVAAFGNFLPAAWQRRPEWREFAAGNPAVGLRWRDPSEVRIAALHGAYGRLREGGVVFLAADGPSGREAFSIPVPGGAVSVRTGWLALRRLARAVTLPVLPRLERGRLVVRVYPPLPPPQSDPGADARACHAALAPLLEDYVRRHPEQCRVLAIRPGSSTD